MTQYSLREKKKQLDIAMSVWFIIAVIGQWIFGIYVIIFYGTAIITGHTENWNKVLPHGYVAGDTTGNLVVGSHLLLSAIIIFGGPVQLMPKIRKHMPAFHKWNGRIYILCAYIISLSGFYMVWVRGSVGGIIQHVSISINALLIMVFATLTIKYAMARNIKMHRIWAIRLFLVMNGVWFFRIGLNFWLLINQGPAGFDPETFTGPFLYVLTFSQYLIPLVIFELYLKGQKSVNENFVRIVSAILLLAILLITLGIFEATKEIWVPKMF